MTNQDPQPKISAMVITFNEERFLRDCLVSLDWVNEIVVIDAESQDGTVAIAKEFTDRVFIRPWTGFPEQRNFGIEQASYQWVLVLDADERVTPESKEEITTWLLDPEAEKYAAFLVPRRNFFFGKWIRFGGAYPDPQYRIFQKEKIRYDANTLDTPHIDGPTKLLVQPFDHVTGETVKDRIRKINRETNFKARMLLTQKERISWSDLFFRPIINFLNFFLFKQGFRDGIEGFIYSGLASFHTFLRYAKCLEIMEQSPKNKDRKPIS